VIKISTIPIPIPLNHISERRIAKVYVCFEPMMKFVLRDNKGAGGQINTEFMQTEQSSGATYFA